MISNTITDVQLLVTNSYNKLRAAIDSENFEKIQSICVKYPRILTATLDKEGNTPLLYAILNGSMSSVKTLIASGSDIDLGNTINGLSPLQSVIINHSEHDMQNASEMIDLLISNNCQIDFCRVEHSTTPHGVPLYQQITPLMDAIFYNNVEMVEKLLEKGADINFTCSFTGNTPMMYALSIGSQQIFQLLIKHSADVNACSSDGNSSLHWLASCDRRDINYTPMVDALIAKGCDVNLQNTVGQSPLMIAISKSNCDLAAILVSKNCNLDLMDTYEFKAIDYAKNIECEKCIGLFQNEATL